MHFTPTDIPEVILISPKVFKDERGYFMETYRQTWFEQAGITETFVQDNESVSQQGTLRGLHFQKPPFEQAKLVRVLEGEILDVAVDIRPNSPTYLKWVSTLLDSQSHNQLYIPKGFAHGFYVTSKTAKVFYQCSNYYAPEAEGGLRWNDPRLAIQWPTMQAHPTLSPKDTLWPLVS